MGSTDAGAAGGPTWREPAVHALLIVALLAVASWHVVRFVRAEHTLYHADRVAYWSFSRSLEHGLRSQPAQTLGAVAHSVAHDDIGLLPALPVATVMVVTGGSRLAYLLAVVQVYGLAVLVGLVVATRGCGGGGRPGLGVRAAALAGAVLLFPTLLRPVLLGYLDLGGVALGLAVVALYLGHGAAPAGTKRLALVGLLLAAMILFRRWYSIWAFAFVVVAVGDAAVSWWQRRDGGRAAVLDAARPVLVAVGVCGLTLLAVAWPLMLQRLTTDYGDRFSAYSVLSGPGERLAAVAAEFGLLPLAMAAGCAVVLAAAPATRRFSVFLVLHLATTWTVMTSIQDHTPQHWYLYLPGALALVAVGIGQWVRRVPRHSARAALLTCVLGFAMVVTLAGLSRQARRALPGGAALAPAAPVVPAVRTDLGEVVRLLGFLDQLERFSPGWVYVLASSPVLADQVLAYANLSLGTSFRSPARILQAAQVDLRDGFPEGLLEARVVLVADPIQVHLDPADQQVVVTPARMFLDGEGPAAAFRRLPQRFRLDGGVTVRVYERMRRLTEAEVAELSGELRRLYPERPSVWRPGAGSPG